MQSIPGHGDLMSAADHNFLLTHLLGLLMVWRSHIESGIVIVIKNLTILAGFDCQSWIV